MAFDTAPVLERLDQLIADQLGAILRHPSLRELERAWRSLWFVVERVDFTQTSRWSCSIARRTSSSPTSPRARASMTVGCMG